MVDWNKVQEIRERVEGNEIWPDAIIIGTSGRHGVPVLSARDDALYLLAALADAQEQIAAMEERDHCWECSGEQLQDHLCLDHEIQLRATLAPGGSEGRGGEAELATKGLA